MDGSPRRTIITANRLVKRFITRRWSGWTRKRSVARSPVRVEMGSGTFWSVATARLAIREAPHIRIALFLPWQVQLSLCAKTTEGAAGSSGIVSHSSGMHNIGTTIFILIPRVVSNDLTVISVRSLLNLCNFTND